jgi:hypothetical protein
MLMKIGILGCFYNCDDLLPHVLNPWLELKREGFDIVFSVINSQFNEYKELGFENKDNKTQDILKNHHNDFLSLLISDVPLSEKVARSQALEALNKAEVDLVWLLDGDEVYTTAQIKNILQFIEHTNFDYYHVYMRNRIFDTIEWLDDYFPPRVFRTNRHGGIKSFVWDNELVYNDGTAANNLVPGIVPKSTAFINHFTWRRKDAAQKIAYHQKHFGFAMYRLTEDGELVPDESYFKLHQIPLPKIAEDGTIERSYKPIVEVILRSHTTGNFREGAVRVTDDIGGKRELSIRVVRSIVASLLVLERLNDYTIKFTILDDHSDEVFLEQIRHELQACPFETQIINLPTSGNSSSMEYALWYAKERQQDFIYFVEDDYLHEPSTLVEILLAYKNFSTNLGHPRVAFFPVDYIDYYLPGALAPTRIVTGQRRHWRTSTTTTCTFFIPRILLDAEWPLFLKNPRDNMVEGESINVVWRERSVLFSPIPTLAIHMHREETMPPFSDWRRLWNKVSQPLYV